MERGLGTEGWGLGDGGRCLNSIGPNGSTNYGVQLGSVSSPGATVPMQRSFLFGISALRKTQRPIRPSSLVLKKFYPKRGIAATLETKDF